MLVEYVDETDDAAEEDPRGRPRSPAEALPPVRWQLSLLAGVGCAFAAILTWIWSKHTWMTVVASVAAGAWLLFAYMTLKVMRRQPTEPGDESIEDTRRV